MTKTNAFVNEFLAIAKGDTAEANAFKAWRKAESALTSVIATKKGETIDLEELVDDAKDAVRKARVNNGQPFNGRAEYVKSLLNAKLEVKGAEKNLNAHNETIDALQEEYDSLKKEVAAAIREIEDNK